MDIPIKIDPTQTVSAAQQIGDALGKAEQAGTKAGDNVGKSFESSISRIRSAKDSIEELTNAINGLGNTGAADRFEREAAAYEKIKGPIRDYMADLQSLDALLDKGMISANEYADALAKLNRSIELSRPGDVAGATPRPETGGFDLSSLTGQLGPAGGMVSQFATATTAAAGLSVALIKAGDDYVELTNRVQRFADSQHSADAIVSDQLALAGDMHAGLDKTVDLYARLRQGTDDLNLTYNQSIDLTKTLGEAVQISGGSLDQASGIAQKLTYAMDSGTISGRELKSIMREVPPIADLWTESFGKSRAELIDMANKGELNVNDLVTTLADGGQDIQEQFGNRIETVGTSWEHFKDVLTVTFGKVVEGS